MAGSQIEGVVIRQHRSHYVVEGDDGNEYLCGISSKLRKNLEYPEADRASRRRRVQEVHEIGRTSAVVVGDVVTVEPGEEQSMIMTVRERESLLSRESPGRRNLQQIIAANVDQVLAVISVDQPEFDADLLNRLLCGAERQGLDACICLTKTDLGVSDVVEQQIAGYPDTYPVLRTSVTTGEGIESVRAWLEGKTSVAVGMSGVGKTSLINALEPGLEMRVQPVNRRTGKGRHTTTHIELVRLSSGGHLVDAPGLRELSLWSVEPHEIEGLFPEFEPLIGTCRFGTGCWHEGEPGCAVRDAVDAGSIARHRHETYLALVETANEASTDIRDRRRPRPSK